MSSKINDIGFYEFIYEFRRRPWLAGFAFRGKSDLHWRLKLLAFRLVSRSAVYVVSGTALLGQVDSLECLCGKGP